MEVIFPNIAHYINATCHHPSLRGNCEFLMEDFLVRLNENANANSSCSKNKSETDQNETKVKDNQPCSSERSADVLFNTLINGSRNILKHFADTNEITNKEKEESETKQCSPTAMDKEENGPQHKEKVVQIENNQSISFEFNFNFEGCNSDSIKIKIEEGIIKATGKSEVEDVIKTISYEKKLPPDVDTSSLKASFLDDGNLKIVAVKSEEILISKQ